MKLFTRALIALMFFAYTPAQAEPTDCGKAVIAAYRAFGPYVGEVRRATLALSVMSGRPARVRVGAWFPTPSRQSYLARCPSWRARNADVVVINVVAQEGVLYTDDRSLQNHWGELSSRWIAPVVHRTKGRDPTSAMVGLLRDMRRYATIPKTMPVLVARLAPGAPEVSHPQIIAVRETPEMLPRPVHAVYFREVSGPPVTASDRRGEIALMLGIATVILLITIGAAFMWKLRH